MAIVKVEVNVGNDQEEGLDLMREALGFKTDFVNSNIEVSYVEWHKSPTGNRIGSNIKKYNVTDKDAIINEGVEVVPAKTKFTEWAEMLVTAQMEGLKLGNDIILGSINTQLAAIPIGAINGFEV